MLKSLLYLQLKIWLEFLFSQSDKRGLQRFASKWSTPLPNPPRSSGRVPDRAGGVNVLHSIGICCKFLALWLNLDFSFFYSEKP